MSADRLFPFRQVKYIRNIPEHATKKYRKLTAQEYFEAFQDSSSTYYDSTYEAAYYFSNQGEWHDTRRYIFIKLDERCCTNFYYNIYNKHGKKLNSFIIARSGGDGGWTINEECTFHNDSTVQRNRIMCDTEQNAQGKETSYCDSSFILYHLSSNGNFEPEASFKKVIK